MICNLHSSGTFAFTYFLRQIWVQGTKSSLRLAYEMIWVFSLNIHFWEARRVAELTHSTVAFYPSFAAVSLSPSLSRSPLPTLTLGSILHYVLPGLPVPSDHCAISSTYTHQQRHQSQSTGAWYELCFHFYAFFQNRQKLPAPWIHKDIYNLYNSKHRCRFTHQKNSLRQFSQCHPTISVSYSHITAQNWRIKKRKSKRHKHMIKGFNISLANLKKNCQKQL